METTAEIKGIFEALPYIKKIGADDILDDGIFLRLRGKKVVGPTITNISKKFKK